MSQGWKSKSRWLSQVSEVVQDDEVGGGAHVERSEGFAEALPGQAVVGEPEAGGAVMAEGAAATLVAPEVGGAQLAPHVVVQAVGAQTAARGETVDRRAADAVVHVRAAAVHEPHALGLEGLHVDG